MAFNRSGYRKKKCWTRLTWVDSWYLSRDILGSFSICQEARNSPWVVPGGKKNNKETKTSNKTKNTSQTNTKERKNNQTTPNQNNNSNKNKNFKAQENLVGRQKRSKTLKKKNCNTNTSNLLDWSASRGLDFLWCHF